MLCLLQLLLLRLHTRTSLVTVKDLWPHLCDQDIPRQAQKDKARLLKRMEAEAVEKAKVEREKRITKKYHKVRFVDRQKVTRKLERVEKKIKKLELEQSVRHRARRVCASRERC